MSNEYLNNKYLESIISRFQNVKRNKVLYETLLIAMEKQPADKAERTVGVGLVSLTECRQEYNSCRKDFSDSQDLLATAFYTLAENIVRYAKFNLIGEDDAVQESVMICFENITIFFYRPASRMRYSSEVRKESPGWP